MSLSKEVKKIWQKKQLCKVYSFADAFEGLLTFLFCFKAHQTVTDAHNHKVGNFAEKESTYKVF